MYFVLNINQILQNLNAFEQVAGYLKLFNYMPLKNNKV